MIAVFDTNVVIDALNGLPEADDEYARYERVLVSRITWAAEHVKTGRSTIYKLANEGPIPAHKAGLRTANNSMLSLMLSVSQLPYATVAQHHLPSWYCYA